MIILLEDTAMIILILKSSLLLLMIMALFQKNVKFGHVQGGAIQQLGKGQLALDFGTALTGMVRLVKPGNALIGLIAVHKIMRDIALDFGTAQTGRMVFVKHGIVQNGL